MNLVSFDLNLLVVFDALMTERSVTKAGRKIGLSQPAMSSALSRLRSMLQDPLFVRCHDGMRPSPRALELAGPVRDALEQIQDTLDYQTFDPSIARRTFRIATNDLGAALVLPPLSQLMTDWSKQLNFVVVHADGDSAINLLDTGAADVAIGPRGNDDDRTSAVVLYQAPFACAMRNQHPLATRPLTLETFANAPQIVVSQPGDPGPEIDRMLRKHGLERRVAFTVPHYLPVPFLLSKTDLIAVVPTKLIQRFGAVEGIRTVNAPFAACTISTVLRWAKAAETDKGNIWLRSLLVNIARVHHLETWTTSPSQVEIDLSALATTTSFQSG